MTTSSFISPANIITLAGFLVAAAIGFGQLRGDMQAQAAIVGQMMPRIQVLESSIKDTSDRLIRMEERGQLNGQVLKRIEAILLR